MVLPSHEWKDGLKTRVCAIRGIPPGAERRVGSLFPAFAMSFMDAREHGSKVGSAGVASAQNEAIDRRERLRRLALETIDLAKDPYFMRNHVGSYECKLCLTVHGNEGNYLAHTQGKRHQQNLARRATRDARDNPSGPALNLSHTRRTIQPRKTAKIGRPGYRVTKQFCRASERRSLLFQVDYPEIEDGLRPRHRFMSAYEQKVEPWDKAYQYLLIAAEPYETVAFKIPNAEVEKRDANDFVAHWEPDKKTFTLQLFFKKNAFGRLDKSALSKAGNTKMFGAGYGAPPPPGALPVGFAPSAVPPPPPPPRY